jgi:hypothetical protein
MGIIVSVLHRHYACVRVARSGISTGERACILYSHRHNWAGHADMDTYCAQSLAYKHKDITSEEQA